METKIITSPPGEQHQNVLPIIPLSLKFNSAVDEIGTGEIDLLMSALDGILLEMQSLEAELSSIGRVKCSEQPMSINVC